MKIYKFLILALFASLSTEMLLAQPVPAKVENIPNLVTFGNEAETYWGDDDFSQVFFFIIPAEYSDPVYIRVFDPDCGGKVDEINMGFNTRTEFSVYGGASCWSDRDAQGTQPIGNYKSGNLLASKIFGIDPKWDNKWYTFGPFDPHDGEFSEEFNGYYFKMITEGISGNDGNLYRYYLSTEEDRNVSVEGGNAFTYEYTFRLWNDTVNISHIYPYVEEGTVRVKQRNFDWDSDGRIDIYSVTRNNSSAAVSGEDFWSESEIVIMEGEIGKSLDFQFVKRKNPMVVNNNVVITTMNQYEENLRFFTKPIGGVPKYKSEAIVEPDDN